ncbi:replication protein A 70 kDa DNA-binding subunit isoform X2 [Solenopsis invicta]|uniref:replication protein A 70 kDa DNA-binding subunit isoform X2 n=1 Tax=Solenopsis invicta TaxID=13686 RepID=UPI00193D486C|nr:replication protein A 70 kDa DNA-binding subunit isoform X2 [Solenopsis invicta]
MDKYNLTTGALQKIMKGINIDKPILQMLGYKKLPKNKDGATDRYRLLVSDGEKLNSFTMLATQLNNLIENDILNEFSICKITNYCLSSVNNNGKEKCVMLILDIEVIVSGEEVGRRIGNPTNIELKSEQDTPSTSTTTTVHHQNGSTRTGNSNHASSDIRTTQIAALSPYQNRWVIKARVINKSPIKTWSNSRGEGKFFSMDLIDKSGEIRCTAFKEMVDKFYDLIVAGNVYYISRCTLKMANKQYNTMKNDYEMSVTSDTGIVPCHDNSNDIPTLQYNFSPISQVESKEKNDLLDVLGVVTTIGDVQHFTARATGRELIKRDISIVDDSGTMVTVTLWRTQAEEFDASNNTIIAIKRASVGEFNGRKNLSLTMSSIIEKDPDIPEAHRLRGWYTAVGHSETAKSLSRVGGSTDFNGPLYTFQEATDARLGEKMNLPDSFTVVATIKQIKTENSLYRACPVENCKKKLIDQDNGIFRCEKCNKEYPNFTYRLLANMELADATGSRWITAFNEEAEKILGMSAQELGELKENDKDAYLQKIGEATFKTFMFNLEARSEVFQGYKKLPKNKDGVDRYRLLVSDGEKLNSFTMLATQLNNLIEDDILNEFSICKITNYYLSSVSKNGKEKRVMLILDIEVVVSGEKVGGRIGNPTNIELKSEPDTPSTSTTTTVHHQSSTRTGNSNHASSDIRTTPIAALSPYQNRWVIKARVIHKSLIKTWSDSRGEGKFFFMGLIDESGEIRCKAFGEMVDKFYDLIVAGNVYYISRCTLKTANKQYNSMKNDYEMLMTSDTEIVPCRDSNNDIPTLQYNFSPISQVEHKEKNDLLDVLGVVTTVGDVQHFTARTGRELIKRNISIVDDSDTMVTVTLWGTQAEEFDASNNTIIAIKEARVDEFNGKHLSLIMSSIIEKDPNIPEAHRLRGWYTAVGHSETAKSLSRVGGSTDFNGPLYTFQEATDARLGKKMNLPDSFTIVATIKQIRTENSPYRACPLESCKKKLIDQNNGTFRCEKCNKKYPNFTYRLLANMELADATGSRWITAFNEEAEKILGMSAQELGELKENDKDAYLQKIGEATFKTFMFNLKARSEVFQDTMRIKRVCTSVRPINYKTYLPHLIDKVSKLLNIEKLDSN